MKKLFIITMLLIVSCRMYSQEYYPLVGENKEWNVLQVLWAPLPSDTGYNTDTYKFSGDTVIDNLIYKKIFKLSANWSLIGWVREDESKKVWSRGINNPLIEKLIYDFSLEEGDTAWIIEPFEGHMIVDSITLIDIGGNLRRKIHFSYTGYPEFRETWIEGIGSNRGILNIGSAGWDGGWSWLLCMKENGQLVYANPSFESCYLNVGINEKLCSLPKISIFPNPANSFITINIKEGIAIEEAIIYNHFGHKVLEVKPVNNTVDVSGLRPGIYFIEVAAKEWRGRTKLIIKY